MYGRAPSFAYATLHRGPSCRSACVLSVVGTPRIVAHKINRSMRGARKPRYLFLLPLDARLRTMGLGERFVIGPSEKVTIGVVWVCGCEGK